MRRRHDPFLKRFHRLALPDTLRLFLPELVQPLRWDTLEWIEKEVVIPLPAHRLVIADLVGRVQDVENRYLEVLVHPEIQAQTYAQMDWRMFEYNTGLILQRNNPDVPVLGFVLYHCAGAGGIQERHFKMDFYGRTIHDMTYWSIGIGDLNAEDYISSDNPAAWALTAWMRKPKGRRVRMRLEMIQRILSRVQEPGYRQVLFDALLTYFRLNRREEVETQQILESGEYGEAGEEMMTVLEKLEAKGRREGQREALQNSLLLYLRTRYIEVPADLEAQIRAISNIDRLNELIAAAYRSQHLEDFIHLLHP